MKHLLTFITIIVLASSCQQSENVSELQPDYETLLYEVEQIRDQDGFIPLKLISSDFSLTDIDFSQHQGIKSTGVTGVTLVVTNDNTISIEIKSDISDINGSSLHVIPNSKGYFVDLEKVNSNKYQLNYQSDGQNHYFNDLNLELENQRITNEYELNENYQHEINVSFKVTNHILFAIREIYFKHLVKKMPDSFFKQKNHNTNARLDNADVCEYFPSVYLETFAWSVFNSSIIMEGNLNAECSNQYCIGCCNYYIEKGVCFGNNTGCILRGFGFVCESYPNTGGYFGDCTANSPCYIDSPT